MGGAGGGVVRRDMMLGAVACCLAPELAVGSESDLPQKGDKLVFDEGPEDGKPVTAEGVAARSGVTIAIPLNASGEKKAASRFSKVLLVSLKPEDILEEYRSNGVDGVLAFSAICTHQGCTINAFARESNHLACFCHHSEFMAAEGGAVAHGPARKRLPMLPITKGDGGVLVVAGEFTGKPGPGPM